MWQGQRKELPTWPYPPTPPYTLLDDSAAGSTVYEEAHKHGRTQQQLPAGDPGQQPCSDLPFSFCCVPCKETQSKLCNDTHLLPGQQNLSTFCVSWYFVSIFTNIYSSCMHPEINSNLPNPPLPPVLCLYNYFISYFREDPSHLVAKLQQPQSFTQLEDRLIFSFQKHPALQIGWMGKFLWIKRALTQYNSPT